MNKSIVERIKLTRKSRGLTQQDLAERLGKTAAAISELERGKVQISASDLFDLSELLNKPIEYFFGVNIGGDEIQDLINIFQKMPADKRASQINGILTILKLRTIAGGISNIDLGDKGSAIPVILKIYEALVQYILVVNSLREDGLKVKSDLEEVLGLEGEQIVSYSGMIPK